jgi:hypothetical protein
MKRVELIQYLIDHYGFKSYLEIGTAGCTTFNAIKCERKVGVDPLNISACRGGNKLVALPSDAFFFCNIETFDVVFIDGLHLYEQVIKDIVNSWKFLNLNGFIICHDMKPLENTCGRKPKTPASAWNGDVYKAWIWFKDAGEDTPSFVLDDDWGLGIIHKIEDLKINVPEDFKPYDKYTWEWLNTNWGDYGLVSGEYIKEYTNGKRYDS